MEPMVALVRRWAVDWLARGDVSVCPEIYAEDFSLGIGGVELTGRDAYVEATVAGLLDRWPGVSLTVHEVICNGSRAAVRCSEHGTSAKDGAQASWSIVTLFDWDGERFTRGWAEEDYLARRRQLKTGTPDPVEAPAIAPWAAPALAPDPNAETVVRAWLEAGEFEGVDLDDGPLGQDTTLDFTGDATELDDLFSAGPKVAFHGVCRGAHALHFAGIVEVQDGVVTGGRVIRDRLGLSKAAA